MGAALEGTGRPFLVTAGMGEPLFILVQSYHQPAVSAHCLDNAVLTHEIKSHELMETLQAQMEALLKQNKPQEAFDVWRAYPQSWRMRETDEEIGRLLNQRMPANFQPK